MLASTRANLRDDNLTCRRVPAQRSELERLRHLGQRPSHGGCSRNCSTQG
jgi:hypothetical protein